MRNLIMLLVVAMLSSGCLSQDVMKSVEGVLGDLGGTSGGAVTNSEIIQGLKQALEVGITKGASTASKTDGFFKNPQIKIPFPPEVKKVENTLRDLGLNNMVDKVVLSLNRGAEDAAKQAKPIFVSAIKKMTIKDATKILTGGQQNAATEYLKTATTGELRTAFSPVVKKSLSSVNATKFWDDAIGKYNQIPLVKKIDFDLDEFVTDRAIQGLFTMVAKEELKIRKDPLSRTTDLLKRVFKLQD